MKKRFGRILALCMAILVCFSAVASADVSKGAKGEEVRRIQQKLYELGYLTGSVDGVFGNGTEKAVIDFQRAEGLPTTGVVDRETNLHLENPVSHLPYFHNAMLEISTSTQDGDMGKNSSGQRVDWVIDLIIPRESWMDETDPAFLLGWTDDPVNAAFDTNWMPAWNNAKRGITSYECTPGYWWDKRGNEYSVFYYRVFLPDEPNLAGRRWMEMECMGDKAIVYFTLEYKGDYATGTGWRMKDVTFENTVTASVPTIDVNANVPASVGSEPVNSVLNNLEVYDGCGWSYDKSDTEASSIGFNNKGEEVVYGIFAYLEGAQEEISMQSVSWTDNPILADDWYDNWMGAKKGETYYTSSHSDNTQSDGTRMIQDSIYIFLPDNPNIAGEQWFSLSCGAEQALVRVKLIYNGSYQTGRGWTVQLLENKVTAVKDRKDEELTNTYAGHQYMLIESGLSWLEAEEYCMGLGGHLVSINSLREKNFVVKLAKKSKLDYFWTGGYRNGSDQWAWIDGSSFSYTNWDINQPDNYEGKENYIRFTNKDLYYPETGWEAHEGKWNDSQKTGDSQAPLSSFGFICEIG